MVEKTTEKTENTKVEETEVEDVKVAATPKKETSKKDEVVEFKGKYLKAIGRRKTAVAQVRMYEKGEGNVIINGISVTKYFAETEAAIAVQPIKLAGIETADFSILVKGSGKSSQAEACRHGIARLLIVFNEDLKLAIKAKGWLTRDSRKVERKKPGLKKARRAPQWSKR